MRSSGPLARVAAWSGTTHWTCEPLSVWGLLDRRRWQRAMSRSHWREADQQSPLWGGDPLRQMGPPSGPPKYSKTAHFRGLLMHLWGGWIISTECSPVYTDLWTIFKRKRPFDLPSHEKWEQKPPKYYYSFMPRFRPSLKTFIFVKSVKIAAIITERAGDRLTQVSAGHVWVAHYWIWLISFVDRRISTHGFSTEMATIRPKRCLDD